jgi:hypothetical protein
MKGKKMSYNGKILYRKQWEINPRTRIHSTKKGAKGYSRNEFKKQDKNGKWDDNEM